MLTVTAIRALRNIAAGRQAFSKSLKSVGSKLARDRQAALHDLYRLGLIRKGPCKQGPHITKKGRAFITDLRDLLSARRGKHRWSIYSERYNIPKGDIHDRVYKLKKLGTLNDEMEWKTSNQKPTENPAATSNKEKSCRRY